MISRAGPAGTRRAREPEPDAVAGPQTSAGPRSRAVFAISG